MDGRLPAQLRRPLQVAAPLRFGALRGQAPVVDPDLLPRPLQRPVGFLLPDLPGLLYPGPGHHRAALLGPAALRVLRVVAPEPLLRAALLAVQSALTDYQVRVWIAPLCPAPVDRQRIGQPLFPAQPLGEAAGQRAALPLVQLHGQRHFHLLVQPPVDPLVVVCRLPVFAGIVLCPSGQVAALFVFQFFGVLGIAALAPKVIKLGAGRLAAAASAGFHVQVKDGHAPALALSGAPGFAKQNPKVRPSLSPGMVRDPQKELDELNKRKAELEDSLSKREAELKELRSKKKSLLERQIRRAQVRINAKERKRRTCRLILLGSYLDDIIQNDPVSMKRVSKGLDEFLERDRDRALFDLLPRPKEVS